MWGSHSDVNEGTKAGGSPPQDGLGISSVETGGTGVPDRSRLSSVVCRHCWQGLNDSQGPQSGTHDSQNLCKKSKLRGCSEHSLHTDTSKKPDSFDFTSLTSVAGVRVSTLSFSLSLFLSPSLLFFSFFFLSSFLSFH